MSNNIEIKNAIIKKAIITTDESHMLSAWLELDYGGSFQAFGWYKLYTPKPWAGHSISYIAVWK